MFFFFSFWVFFFSFLFDYISFGYLSFFLFFYFFVATRTFRLAGSQGTITSNLCSFFCGLVDLCVGIPCVCFVLWLFCGCILFLDSSVCLCGCLSAMVCVYILGTGRGANHWENIEGRE